MATRPDRDRWDRHNRDEAAARASQQASAGPTHRPVPTEPYAAMQPAPRDAALNLEVLLEEYESATAAENVAWLVARGRIGDPTGVESWNTWRDAVERTQRAAHCLIDYGIARSA